MISLDNAIVVEGKYDKIRLSNIFDCLIITTDGFSIFKDKQKQDFLKSISKNHALIVLTDSDSAGFMIRNFISNIVGQSNVINVYTPDIFGKERRKAAPGKENLLGVEGIEDGIIIDAFKKAGVLFKTEEEKQQISKLDLFELGLIGGSDSAQKRKKLLLYLNLPQRMNTNSLIKALNKFISKDELERAVSHISKEDL